jgi:endogenous inhibitor of DNA gyrase (YacG/DUF329 family)
MSLFVCPTCQKSFDPAASRTMPFCSDRCRKIDLGRWLKEEISIPYDELPENGDPSRDKPPVDEN